MAGPAGLCFNGFAFTVEFDLAGVTVPDEIIFSVAFNTSTFGNSAGRCARSLTTR